MAKHRGDPRIGHRMWAEVTRLFESHGHASYRMDIEPSCISTWKTGVMPNAYALQRLALCGGDVMWVLTGERSGSNAD